MTTKNSLITDSFKVVKKARRDGLKKRENRAPSPPQKDQTETETIVTAQEKELMELRQFDLDWRYGPCTGISRLQRWQRAELHGLNPPEEIRDLLLHTHTDPQHTKSLWSDYPL